MSNDKEQWFDEVYRSMEGSQRAVPRPELFAEIERQVSDSRSNVISMFQLKRYAAAVVLLLIANAVALISYNHSEELPGEEYTAVEIYDHSFISSYQIYTDESI